MVRRLTFKTIGCDPELFLLDKDTKEVISSEGIIPGTKEDPYFISNQGHMLQLDNVLTEFGIPPSKTEDDFVKNIKFVLNYIKRTYDKYEIGTMASAELDEKYLQTEQALLFGCEPDWNVWIMQQNPSPEAVSKKLRSAGGHVHVGVEETLVQLDETMNVVKLLDLCLGVPSVLLDKDTRRRELYGKAGAFRFKPYLAEYRTLSNFWIHNEDYMRLVYKNTLKSLDMYNNGDLQYVLDNHSDNIVNAINNNDKSLAEKLIKEFSLL